MEGDPKDLPFEHDIPIPIRGRDAVSRSLELLAEIEERHDYAVFSEESKRIGGSAEYESLDTPGALVEVTWVGPSKNMAALKFGDKQYRGRVGRFVRIIKESNYFADRDDSTGEMYPIMIPFVVDKRPFYAVRSEKQILKTGIYYWFESIDNPGERVAASMYFHPGLPLDPADTRKNWDDIVELGQVGKLIEMIDLNEIFPAPKYHTQIDIEEVD